MAKDDFEDDFDFDTDMDEFDIGDFEDIGKEKKDPSINKKDRKAIDVLKDTAKQTKDFAKENKLTEKLIMNSLPKEMKEHGATLADLFNESRNAFTTGMSQVTKEINELRKNGAKIAAQHDKLIPERVKKFLNNYKKEESSYSRGEASLDDKIKGSLDEVFGAQIEYQKQQGEQQLVRDQIERKRFETQQDLLYGIRRATHVSAQYTTEITSKYQRKNLELQHRQVFLQSNILKTLLEMQTHQKEALDGIVKNTALPDIVKAHKSEVIKEMGFRNLVDLSSKGFSAFFGNFKENAIKSLTSNIKDFAGGAADLLSMGNMGADAYLMQQEMMEDFGQKQSAGRQLGGLAAQLITSQLGKRWLTPKLARHKRVQAVTSFLGNKVGNAATTINRLKSQGTGNMLLDGILDMLPGGQEAYKSHNFASRDKLKDLAQFDIATRKSIVDIIPQLLSKIHQSVEGVRMGYKGKLNDNNLLEWDHDSAGLVARKDIDAKFLKTINEKLNLDGQMQSATMIVKAIDPTFELSAESRAAFIREIMSRAGSWQGFEPADYVNDNWKTNPKKYLRQEVQQFLIGKFKLSEDVYGDYTRKENILDADIQNSLKEANYHLNRLESQRGDAQNWVLNNSTINDTDLKRMVRLNRGQLSNTGSFSVTDNNAYYTRSMTNGLDLSEANQRSIINRWSSEGKKIRSAEFRERKGYDPASDTVSNPFGQKYLNGQPRLTLQELDLALQDPSLSKLDREWLYHKNRMIDGSRGIIDAAWDKLKGFRKNKHVQKATEMGTQYYSQASSVVNEQVSKAATTIKNNEKVQTAVQKAEAKAKELGIKEFSQEGLVEAVETWTGVNVTDSLNSAQEVKDEILGKAYQTYVDITGEEPAKVAELFNENPKEAVKHLAELGVPLAKDTQETIVKIAKEKNKAFKKRYGSNAKDIAKNMFNDLYGRAKGVDYQGTWNRLKSGFSNLNLGGRARQAYGTAKDAATAFGTADYVPNWQFVNEDTVNGFRSTANTAFTGFTDAVRRGMQWSDSNVQRGPIGKLWNKLKDWYHEGEPDGWLDEQGDVFVKGEDFPRLTKAEMHAGKYYLRISGKPLLTLRGIRDEIMDVNGNVVLNSTDLSRGIVNREGKEIPTGYSGRDMVSFSNERSIERRIIDTIGATMRSTDVYTKDNPDTPVITRFAMMTGRYVNSKGKPILSIKDIDGAVYDQRGNMIITEEQVRAGLVDKKGRPLRGYIMRRLRVIGDVHKKLYKPVFGLMGKLMKPFGKMLPKPLQGLGKLFEYGKERSEIAGSAIGGMVSGAMTVSGIQSILEKLFGKKRRAGNAEDILTQQDRDYEAKRAGKDKDGKTPEKKEGGILGFLKNNFPLIAGSLGGILTMVSKVKDSILDGFGASTEWMKHGLLGTLFKPFMWLGRGIAGIGGKLVSGIGGVLGSVLGPVLNFFGLKGAANFLKGKGAKSGIMKFAKGLIRKPGAAAILGAGLLAGMTAFTKEAQADVPDEEMNTDISVDVQPGAGFEQYGQAVGAESSGPGMGDVASTAASAYLMKSQIKTGTRVIANQVGKVIAKQTGKFAARAAITAASGPLAPLVGLAMTLWTLWDIGSLIWDWMTSPNKKDDFRIVAYGVNPALAEHAKTILKFEEWVMENGSYNQANGNFDFPDLAKKKDQFKDLMACFMGGKEGAEAMKNSPEGTTENFIETLNAWYMERFQPVFISNLNAVFRVIPKANPKKSIKKNVDDLSKGLIMSWARRAKLPVNENSPYNVRIYPFFTLPGSEDEEAANSIPNGADVENFFNILKEEYQSDEDKLRKQDKSSAEASKRTGWNYTSRFAFEEDEKKEAARKEALKVPTAGITGSITSMGEGLTGTLTQTAAAVDTINFDKNGTNGPTYSAYQATKDNLDDAVTRSMNTEVSSLDAIRLRLYGFNKLIDTKVKVVYDLERYLLNYVKIGSDKSATLENLNLENVVSIFAIQLGWNKANPDDYTNFVGWFQKRFCPVYLRYIELINEKQSTKTPLDDVKKFDKDYLYKMALALLGIKVTINDESVSIWQVPFGPVQGENPNMDSSSVAKNVLSLQNGITEKELAEKDLGIASQSKNNDTSSTTPNGNKKEDNSIVATFWKALGVTLPDSNGQGGTPLPGSSGSVIGTNGTTGTPGVNSALPTSGEGWQSNYTPPTVSQQAVIDEYVKVARADGVDDNHIAMMLANIEAESKFQPQSEKLGYSVSNLLDMKYQRGKFSGSGYASASKNLAAYSDDQIRQIASDPNRQQIIGDIMYGNRMGNAGNEGFKYRGRGLIQLTGKENYQQFSKLVGVDLVNNPDLANDPKIAVRIAHEYAKQRGIYKGDFTNSVKRVVGSANVGSFGVRQSNYQKHLANMSKHGNGEGLKGTDIQAQVAPTTDSAAPQAPNTQVKSVLGGYVDNGPSSSPNAGNGTLASSAISADTMSTGGANDFFKGIGFLPMNNGSTASQPQAPLLAAQNTGINSAIPTNLGEGGQIANMSNAAIGGQYKWIEIASKEIGVREEPGSASNPRVIEYHQSIPGGAKSDDVPWCSAFVNWCMTQAGFQGTNSAQAISWAKWAGGQKFDKPCYGSIVVFSYGGGKGHVGFLVGMKEGRLAVLGGNQSNSVKVSTFSLGKVMGFVLPTGIQPIYEIPEYKGPVTVYKNAAEEFKSTRGGNAQMAGNEDTAGQQAAIMGPNTQVQSVLGGYASPPSSVSANSVQSMGSSSIPVTPVSYGGNSAPPPVQPLPQQSNTPSSVDIAYGNQQEKLFNQYGEQTNRMIEIMERSASVQVEMRDHLAKLVDYFAAQPQKGNLMMQESGRSALQQFAGVGGSESRFSKGTQANAPFKMQVGNNPVTSVA